MRENGKRKTHLIFREKMGNAKCKQTLACPRWTPFLCIFKWCGFSESLNFRVVAATHNYAAIGFERRRHFLYVRNTALLLHGNGKKISIEKWWPIFNYTTFRGNWPFSTHECHQCNWSSNSKGCQGFTKSWRHSQRKTFGQFCLLCIFCNAFSSFPFIIQFWLLVPHSISKLGKMQGNRAIGRTPNNREYWLRAVGRNFASSSSSRVMINWAI